MEKGFFIVLEGLDGSGKATQARLLVDRLKSDGYKVELADFPQYGNWSSQFVEKYLRGEFGSSQDVTAHQSSLFFALDRFAARSQIQRWLAEGNIVISNRYVSANKGHQLGKLHDVQEMHAFLDWVNELEYGILQLPVPNVTLFLHMKPELGKSLVGKKEQRSYLVGTNEDIHERDLGHLTNAERAFLFCIEHDVVENWQSVVCFTEDVVRSVEEIHEEIVHVLRTHLS